MVTTSWPVGSSWDSSILWVVVPERIGLTAPIAWNVTWSGLALATVIILAWRAAVLLPRVTRRHFLLTILASGVPLLLASRLGFYDIPFLFGVVLVALLPSRWSLIGDIVVLLSFCCLKQIDAIVTAPDFPGWTAPLEFRYERWVEFSSFLIATMATFCTATYLTGGYTKSSASSVSRLVENCAFVTFITCLMLAAQLVIGVASENASFVGLEGWDDVLPLAARGIGEPWVSAAQLLGVSTGWRVIWYFFVDTSWFLRFPDRLNAYKEAERGVLEEAAKVAAGLALVSFVILRILQVFVLYP